MRQKEIHKLAQGGGENAFILRESVPVEDDYPGGNLPVTRLVIRIMVDG